MKSRRRVNSLILSISAIVLASILAGVTIYAADNSEEQPIQAAEVVQGMDGRDATGGKSITDTPIGSPSKPGDSTIGSPKKKGGGMSY